MGIIVVVLAFALACASVLSLLNDNTKATIVSLLPLPALAICSNYLGIDGLYEFISFCCVCAMLLGMLLVKQRYADKKFDVLFLFLGLGFATSVYFCHARFDLGFHSSLIMAATRYIYFYNAVLFIVVKRQKTLADTFLVP